MIKSILFFMLVIIEVFGQNGIRGTNWGMSKSEVLRSETSNFIMEGKYILLCREMDVINTDVLEYTDIIFDRRTHLLYHFNDAFRLIGITFLFDTSPPLGDVLDAFDAKYGEHEYVKDGMVNYYEYYFNDTKIEVRQVETTTVVTITYIPYQSNTDKY